MRIRIRIVAFFTNRSTSACSSTATLTYTSTLVLLFTYNYTLTSTAYFLVCLYFLCFSNEVIFIISIYNYTNTSTWKLTRNQAVVNNITTPATQGNLTFMGGIWYDTSAISSITLYPDSGNWTSGTAYLYGVK